MLMWSTNSGKLYDKTLLPPMKLSKGKITLPGKKQVYRRFSSDGTATGDVIGLDEEKVEGKRLLVEYMR